MPVFLTRYLGLSDYGIYMYALSLIPLFSLFLDLGFCRSTLQLYTSENDMNKRRAMLGLSYASSCVILLILLSITYILDILNFNIFYLKYDYMYAIILYSFFSLLSLVLVGLGQNIFLLRKYFFLRLILTFGSGAVIITAVFLGYSSLDIIWFTTYFMTFYFILTVIVLRKIAFDYRISSDNFTFYFKRSFWIVWSGASAWLIMFIDRYYIIKYLKKEDLAIYSFSVMMSTLSVMTISTILFPFFKTMLNKYLLNNDLDKINKLNDSYLLFMSVFIIPIFMGLSIYGKVFLIYYAGVDFVKSFQYILPLSLALYWGVSMYFYYEFLSVYKKNGVKIIALSVCIGGILNAVLNAYLIPVYGLQAAAYSSLVSYFIGNIFIFIYGLRHLGGLPYIVNMLTIYGVALLVWGVGSLLWSDSYGIIGVFAFCIISMIIFWVLLYIVMHGFIKDKILFMRILNRDQ